MTEEEWRASESPLTMLDHVARPPSRRKTLLYVAECCHMGWRNQGHASPAPDVECIVRLADGADNFQEVREKWSRWGHYAEEPSAWFWNLIYISARVGDEALPTEETSALIRELFGNPFRPVTFSPSWRTDTAVALARQMYESRDFAAMPILADALQDAGCDNPDILGHCRDEKAGGGSGEPAGGSSAQGGHVRGCWVVDLVLGKE